MGLTHNSTYQAPLDANLPTFFLWLCVNVVVICKRMKSKSNRSHSGVNILIDDTLTH